MKKNHLTILTAFMLIFVITASIVSCGMETPKNDQPQAPVSLSGETAETTSGETEASSETALLQTTCGTFDASPVNEFVLAVPEDEERAQKTFTAEAYGLRLEVTFYGYASEKFEKDFYVRSDEGIHARVKLTNIGSEIRYQKLNVSCTEEDDPHHHKIGTFMKGIYPIYDTASLSGTDCPKTLSIRAIAPGESMEWEMEYTFGKPVRDSADPDFYHDGIPYRINGRKYKGYEDTFGGGIRFEFADNTIADAANTYDITVSVPSITAASFKTE